jgi:hypothetical protein
VVVGLDAGFLERGPHDGGPVGFVPGKGQIVAAAAVAIHQLACVTGRTT